MNWLPWPLIPKRLWPEIKFKEKRAITLEEHQSIIEREKSQERRSFYQLCWHLGGSQSDVAHLNAEDIDWQNRTIAYARQKTGSLAIIHFGDEIAENLRGLPDIGRCFRTCGEFVPATARPSSSNGAMVWASLAYRCTHIATRGPSAPGNAATLNASPRKLSATRARPSIAPTRNGRRFGCRRSKTTNGASRKRT